MLLLANADRQVDLSVASDLPGGSGVDVALLIGEPPADSPLISITDDQDVIVRTAQLRLKLQTKKIGYYLWGWTRSCAWRRKESFWRHSNFSELQVTKRHEESNG